MRLHGKKLQNATNILVKNLGKIVVPYICILFITNGISFSSPQDLYTMTLVGTFHKEPIISIVKVFGNATPFFTSIMQINALYVWNSTMGSTLFWILDFFSIFKANLNLISKKFWPHCGKPYTSKV